MKPCSLLFLVLTLTAGARPVPARAAHPDRFAQEVVPFLTRHCYACHREGRDRGRLALDQYQDEDAVRKDREVWENVVRVVRMGEMPPKKQRPPSAPETEAALKALDGVLGDVACHGLPSIGRVPLHRLSRSEYQNTIRDLVGLDFQPPADFPSDAGSGKSSDLPSLPPRLQEKYRAAAETILNRAMITPASQQRILAHRAGLLPREAAREIVGRFALHAFRRPVPPEEVEHLLIPYDRAVQEGKPFEEGIRFTLGPLLAAPDFLFRIERDPAGARPGAAYRVSDYELAGRLSYFLWNSMPDDELFSLAAEGCLHQVLDLQVRRMLRDPKAAAFVEHFTQEELTLRREKSDSWSRALTEKMLAYALGRGLEPFDQCAVDGILAALKANDYPLSDLVEEAVKSEPFQMRTATGRTP
ncbi:MAG: DUF1592 domain-containing protein [Planctomycetes bacterium]|nr:DUF1592 domain-containing protein [Planctomycetota bacterium]